mmetsp:Transcript_16918/g.52912  ORF Transcript_16918/g.52912 Transcript_16918/m.52912 type:complete len:103 (+) Transcript_16918:1-309(+)
MRRVVERLAKLLRVDAECTAEQAHAALRFCGISAPKSKEVPSELEALLHQINEFTRVFKHHWEEVRADLPSYLQLFGDQREKQGQGGGGGTSPAQDLAARPA